MISKYAENINPSILKWAREQAGLSLEETAKKLKLKNNMQQEGVDKLLAFENGEEFPLRSKLLEMANIYHIPLITFYLKELPKTADYGENFRKISQKIEPKEKGLLDALVRQAHTHQSMARAILADDDDTQKIGFVNSISLDTPIEKAVETIKNSVKIKVNAPGKYQNSDIMFKKLRELIEAQGVFVLLIGNLGSHHTNISETIFRGLAIADNIAPFIIINANDAKTARCFTLLHELVHLFLGSTEISEYPNVAKPREEIEKTEKFCNDIASELLLPAKSIKRHDQIQKFEDAKQIIEETANHYKVSKFLVAYRLKRSNKITDHVFQKLYEHYKEFFRAEKETKPKKDKKKGGPNFYTIKHYSIGKPLLELAEWALKSGELTHTKAATLLGVKTHSVSKILSHSKPARSTKTQRSRDGNDTLSY